MYLIIFYFSKYYKINYLSADLAAFRNRMSISTERQDIHTLK